MTYFVRCFLTTAFAVLVFVFPLALLAIGARQQHQFEQQIREKLIAAGRADEAASLTLRGDLADFGTEVSPYEASLIFVVDLLTKFWWVGVLLDIVTTYGVYVLLGYISHPNATATSPSKLEA